MAWLLFQTLPNSLAGHRAGDTAYFNGKAWDRIVFGLDVVLKSAFAAAAVGAVARNTGYQVCQRLGLFATLFPAKSQ